MLLLEKLGEGSFGVVWKAQENREFFAVKLGEQKALDRYRKEAEIYQAIPRHSGVIRFYEQAVSQDQRPWLKLEYFDGGTLGKWAKHKTKLPLFEVITTMRQIAGAIEHIQKSQIVHADIREENVLRNVDGRVKVIDFNVASRFEEQNKPQANRRENRAPTMLHTQCGTYAGEVDVWAIGCLFYLLVTNGDHLFPVKKTCQTRWTPVRCRQEITLYHQRFLGEVPKELQEDKQIHPLPQSDVRAFKKMCLQRRIKDYRQDPEEDMQAVAKIIGQCIQWKPELIATVHKALQDLRNSIQRRNTQSL